MPTILATALTTTGSFITPLGIPQHHLMVILMVTIAITSSEWGHAVACFALRQCPMNSRRRLEGLLSVR
jgi:hypothetical protein